ncbi:MAG: class I SAM-dependent methyltransferase [Dehalococcoidia bacterium]
MARRTDPEGTETRVINDLVDFGNKRVIEIGCGDGRMTWRYAGRAKSVLGIDPGPESIAAANAARPVELAESVNFRVGDVTSTDFPDGPYDIAVLAWSL